jgi:hypothetical protein
MTIRSLLLHVGKLALCGLAYAIGIIVGGPLASLLGLPPRVVPEGIDIALVGAISLAEGPLIALALMFVARGLAGNLAARTFALTLLTWLAYTVNTQLEASLFSTFRNGFWPSVAAGLPPALFSSMLVAWFYPPAATQSGMFAAWRSFFAHRSPIAWAWRLALAAIAFMPVYWLFGLMVTPFTLTYYEQGMFGLALPGLDALLPVLCLRSLIFLVACLPIIAAWQRTNRGLSLRLGFALFVLVGALGMLVAVWMPLSVRLPHTLEIFADEYTYAALLVLLLARLAPAAKPALSALKPSAQGR